MSKPPAARRCQIEFVKRFMASHPGRTASNIRCSLTRHQVLAADVAAAAEEVGYEFPAGGGRRPEGGKAAPASRRAPTTLGTKSVDEVIESARLDPFTIVERALRDDLPPDQTVEDENLRRHCEISKEDWRDIRVDERFAGWRVVIRRTKKILWCGPKARAKLAPLDSVIVG